MWARVACRLRTMRVELIGQFKPCMTEIYLHVDARMADYIHTHPYLMAVLIGRGIVAGRHTLTLTLCLPWLSLALFALWARISACGWLCVSVLSSASLCPRPACACPLPAFVPSVLAYVRSVSRCTIDSTGASPDNPYCAHVKMTVNISHACFHNYGFSGNAPVRGATRPRPRLTCIYVRWFGAVEEAPSPSPLLLDDRGG